jgi:glycosyltransferase involved in cell wall biosynthesis
VVALVMNAHTPYRAHLHRRLVREIPEATFHSLFTHELSNSPWRYDPPPETNPVLFGGGEHSDAQSRLNRAGHEWRKAGRIIRWLRGHRAAAVIVGGYNDAGRIRLIRWCRRNGIPCFLCADSNVKGDRNAPAKAFVKRLFVRAVTRQLSGVMPCGELGCEYFERYGVPRDRMDLVPYEPDYAAIAAAAMARRDEAAARFGLRPGRRRFIFSGRLVPAKRADLAVGAFVRIAPERPEWDLVMVGAGPEAERLRAMVPPEVRQRVVWTGFVDDQDLISAIYAGGDALVLPSDYEPWALVINEAAAAGLAILSSDVVGAAAELVRDGRNGRVFPPGDLDALVSAMRDVTHPDRIDAMKAASAEVLREWQMRGDPVNGVRHALQRAGVLRVGS